jgi:hypothetical protein
VVSGVKKYIRSLFSLSDDKNRRPPNKGNPRRIDKFFFKNFSILFNHPDSLNNLPTVLYHRFQVSMNKNTPEKDIKIRQVWCVPYAIVALERMFFGKWIDAAVNRARTSPKPIYTIGLTPKEIGSRIISRMYIQYKAGSYSYKRYSRLRKKIYSLDFSKFDSTINLFFIDLIYAARFLTLELTSNAKKVFDLLRLYVKFTPIIYNDILFIKQIGIASGLYLTNFIDTIVNGCFINAASIIESCAKASLTIRKWTRSSFPLDAEKIDFLTLLANAVIDVPDYSVTGDDTLIACTGDFVRLHKKLCSEFGLTPNIKHTYLGTVNSDFDGDSFIYYLGRYWNNSCKPWNPEEYFISHLILRTKFYKFDEFGIQDEEELELFRLLSICLPYVNGWSFINKYYHDWEPFLLFVKNKKDFILLKDWPNEGTEVVSFYRSKFLYDL